MTRIDLAIDWIHHKSIYLPHTALLCSIILILGLAIFNRLDVMNRIGVIIIPLMIVSMILVLNKNNGTLSCENNVLHKISQNTLVKTYIILALFEIVWLTFGENGYLHVLILLVMYSIIALQIFGDNTHPNVVILEIIITTALLVFPQIFVSGYYYGDTDLITHANYADVITNFGNIPSEMLVSYQYHYIYHLLTSIVGQFTGIPNNDILCLVSSIAVISSIPIIYLIAYQFTKSYRISTLTAYFYSTMPIIHNALVFPVSRTMATTAFFILLYFLLIGDKKNIKPYLLLTIPMVVYMTGVHHMQLILTFVILLFLSLGSLIYFRRMVFGNRIIYSILLLIPIVYLTYTYLMSLVGVIDKRFFGQIESESIGNIAIENVTYDLDILGLLGNMYQGILCILIFMGIYLLLTKIPRSKKVMILIPLVSMLFIIYIPMFAAFLPSIFTAMQTHRLMLLLAPFFSLVMALGCVVLLNLSNKRKKQIISLTVVLLLCISFVFSSVIITNINTNQLNIDLNRVSSSLYFTESDEAIFSITNNYIEQGATISSSREYAHYYSRNLVGGEKYGLPIKLNGNMNLVEIFTNDVNNMSQYAYILYPAQRMKIFGLELSQGSGEYVEKIYSHVNYNAKSDELFSKNIYRHDKIYENSEDILFTF